MVHSHGCLCVFLYLKCSFSFHDSLLDPKRICSLLVSNKLLIRDGHTGEGISGKGTHQIPPPPAFTMPFWGLGGEGEPLKVIPLPQLQNRPREAALLKSNISRLQIILRPRERKVLAPKSSWPEDRAGPAATPAVKHVSGRQDGAQHLVAFITGAQGSP